MLFSQCVMRYAIAKQLIVAPTEDTHADQILGFSVAALGEESVKRA
jgi:hypothetical protein